ncbi:hypothetical protein [Pseudomonas gorinensis]
MFIKHIFKLSPLSAAVKVSSFGLLLGVAAQAHSEQGVVAPGESKVIESGETVKNWALQNGSSLTVNGATTAAIRSLGAQLTVNSVRIPRHPATQSTNIRPPVPRSSGQAVGAQRRRFALLV